jgi:transcriptional regulator with XRE-family HTH domain
VADRPSQALADQSAAVHRALGQALRQARLDRSLTQDEVAQRAQISRGSVANIERGEQGLSVPLLMRLAAAVDLDGSGLLASIESPTPRDTDEIPERLRGQLDERETPWVASVVRAKPQ